MTLASHTFVGNMKKCFQDDLFQELSVGSKRQELTLTLPLYRNQHHYMLFPPGHQVGELGQETR